MRDKKKIRLQIPLVVAVALVTGVIAVEACGGKVIVDSTGSSGGGEGGSGGNGGNGGDGGQVPASTGIA